MSKYLYNGVEFEELPDRSWWHYTYRTIYLSTWGEYLAVLSDSPYQYVGYIGGNGQLLFYGLATSGNGVILRQNVAGNWIVLSEFKAVDSPESGVIGQIDIENGAIVIWANYAIRYKDGGLYRAADDDPIPVEPEKKNFCLKSWLTGFALGLAGKPLPLTGSKRDPVAYLYKGIELPPLPEWDKTVYPYAFIRDVAGQGVSYELYAFKTKPYWFVGTLRIKNYGVEDGNTYLKASYSYGYSADWDYSAPLLGQSPLTEKTSGGYISDVEQVVWANFEVVDKEDAVCLVPYNPTPVYRSRKLYSYNGIILEQFPDYDTTTYPFAFIVQFGHENRYRLCICKEEQHLTDGSVADDGIFYIGSGTDDLYCMSSKTNPYWFGFKKSSTSRYAEELVWANYNVLNADGKSIYLPKSDPIPVYDTAEVTTDG